MNQEGTIIVKIIHELAQTLTKLHYYQKSLNYALKGINICNSIESLYLSADLHLLTGKNLVHLQQPEEGLHYIKQSKNIFLFLVSLVHPYLQSISGMSNHFHVNDTLKQSLHFQ
ncbi:hypothetical protein [Peribacillus simplex]|uniref:hypothetical protein n=1 Tax=Peribacillus simplex TaxID=1478 RepID=UPI003D2C0B0F